MPLSLFPPDESVLRAGQGAGILAWGAGSQLRSLPALNGSHESLCVGKAPEKPDRACFGRQSLGGAELNTRPGELVADDAEVAENWAHVGHGREAQGPGWVCGWGCGDPERRQNEICRSGGRDGETHLPGTISRDPGLSLESAALSATALILRRNKTRRLLWVFGHPAHPSEATPTDGRAGSLRE